MPNTGAMTTDVVKPRKVATIGVSGTYGTGILARAEQVGVEAVVITQSSDKFPVVGPTTTVVATQLDQEGALSAAFSGCDGVISRLATTGRSDRRAAAYPTFGTR